MRLFFAIPLNEEIKNLLEDVILRLEKANIKSDINWVHKENLHLTLAFIENFPEEKIMAVQNEIAKIFTNDFALLQLGDIGYFPPNGQVKVFKMSLNGDLQIINKWQKQIKQILKNHNIIFDEKNFTPHLTLGRIKWQRGPLAKFVEYDRLSFTVNNFQMIKSELGIGGSRYEVLRDFIINSIN